MSRFDENYVLKYAMYYCVLQKIIIDKNLYVDECYCYVGCWLNLYVDGQLMFKLHPMFVQLFRIWH